MLGLQPQDLLIIPILALILFGPSRLPKIGRALEKMLGEFRVAVNQAEKPIKEAADTVRDALTEPPLRSMAMLL